MSAMPDSSFEALIAGDALPRIIAPGRWQALRALHSDIDRARERLVQAQSQHRDALENARREARDAAYRDARAEVAAQLAGAAHALRRAAHQQEQELVRLMFATLERLLGEVPADLLTPRLVAAALSRELDRHTVVAVTVHPDVLTPVRDRIESWRAQPGSPPVEVLSDPTLDARDCDIETIHGSVRAGLAGQLATLEAAMLKLCERSVA